MKRWLIQASKRGLLVAGILSVIGFVAIYFLGQILEGMDVATSNFTGPIVFGLILGSAGFALVFIFEILGAGWNAVFGRKPPPKSDSPEAPLSPGQPEDQP